jgi:AraC-like DNA-binding protein
MAYELATVYKQAVAALGLNPAQRLGAVQKALGVERHTIERAFRLGGGKSFRAFRCGLLRRQAVELLGPRSAASAKEIAFLLGYKSERAFARFIRSSFGCSPCELRRQLVASGSPQAVSPHETNHRAA